MNMDILKKTKKEQVMEMIDSIHYEHRYDAGAMFGTLTEQEAAHEYNKLLNIVNTLTDLTPEEKEEVIAEIKAKIAAIPEVEKEKEEEYEKYQGEKQQAFLNAKARYEKLSKFKQLQLIRTKKDPANLDVDFMSTQELNSMYVMKK